MEVLDFIPHLEGVCERRRKRYSTNPCRGCPFEPFDCDLIKNTRFYVATKLIQSYEMPKPDIRTSIFHVEQLQNAKGSNAKRAILEKYKDDEMFCQLLYFTLNPQLTYHISKATLRLLSLPDPEGETTNDTIFDVCRTLSAAKSLTQDKSTAVRRWLYHQPDDLKEFYIKFLSKTLRLGVTAKTVNAVIPELIPEWEVQQSYPIDTATIPEDQEFWLTQKLNGVRATYVDGKLYARSGVPYKGLEHIINELERLPSTMVYDGELLLSEEVKQKEGFSDNEAFRKSTGIINSDSADKRIIRFCIFDAVPVDEFTTKQTETPYRTRRKWLNDLSPLLMTKYVSILPVLYHGTDQQQIDSLLEKMVQEDKEGLMLNLDVPYKRSRHKGILKIKRFYTMDLPILRLEEGSGKLQGTLGAFVVDYKGNEVRVGSGFTDEQRTDFWSKKDELEGVLVEVKYKELSYDKKDPSKESLQFPVFVGLRTDKTEPSYG